MHLKSKGVLFAIGCISLAFSHCFAATFTATADGNWNDGATWGNASPGSVGVDFPGAGDVANIPASRIVIIPSGYVANANTIVINSNSSVASCSLVLADATSFLNVSGNVTMNNFGLSITTTTLTGSLLMNGGAVNISGNLVATAKDNGNTVYNQLISIGSGTLTVTGNITLTNNNNATATIDMNTSNSLLNVGGSFSLGVLNNGSGTNGTINYTSAGAQTVLSAITYYDLTVSGGGLKTLNGNTSVNNTLTMASGNIDLGGNILTLGTSVLSIGTLNHTAGWLYNGSFKRWLDANGFAIGNAKGHYPMGGRNGAGTINRYRPLWIGQGIDLGSPSGGTITVAHTAIFPATYTVAFHNDASWGFNLQGVSESTWTISTSDGYSRDATTGSLRFGGEGFGTNVITDLNASLLASVVKDHSATTGTGTEPYVNRINLTSTDFVNTWRIGTKDVSQSPLPIELLSFNVSKYETKIAIEWITATEINNDYFTVERSSNELHFEEIGIIDGTGNSNEEIHYQLIDYDPLEGTSYYRLKQTDYDGKITYSSIASIEFHTKHTIEMNSFPNPATSGASITFTMHSGKLEEGSLIIENALNEKIYSTPVFLNEEKCIIKVNETFSPGIYFSYFISNGSIVLSHIVIIK